MDCACPAAAVGTTVTEGMTAAPGVVVVGLEPASGDALESGVAIGVVPLDVGLAARKVEDGVGFLVVAVAPRGMRVVGTPTIPGSVVTTPSGGTVLLSIGTDSSGTLV